MVEEPINEKVVSQKLPKTTLLKRIVFLLSLLLFVSLGTTAYLFFKTSKTTSQQNPTPTNSTNQLQNLTLSKQAAQEIEDTVNQIEQGSIQFESNNRDVETFTKSVEITQSAPLVRMVFYVYKHFPGAALTTGYEGVSWERNLSEEISRLQELSFQIVPGEFLIAEPIVGDKPLHPEWVAVGKLNFPEKEYLYYNTTFGPSGSVIKNYVTYNEKTDYYTEIKVDMSMQRLPEYETHKVCSGQNQCADLFIYPEEVQTLLAEIEKYL